MSGTNVPTNTFPPVLALWAVLLRVSDALAGIGQNRSIDGFAVNDRFEPKVPNFGSAANDRFRKSE